METCKICKKTCHPLFNSTVLEKYQVSYFQCQSCKFIQTEKPYWLDEAYSSAIGRLDIGLLYRNSEFCQILPSILDKFTTTKDSYLDYGGGYGVFVRMMRDRGYDFYLYDKYCENLFADFFNLSDYGSKRFAALTAFEVFEHLVDPIQEIFKMFEFSDVIIFSTEIQPDINFKSDQDWWYFVPFGGQHVALYTVNSLKQIASLFECKLYTNSQNLHVLSKLSMDDPFEQKRPESFFDRASRFVKSKLSSPPAVSGQRKSLLSTDFELVKSRLKL